MATLTITQVRQRRPRARTLSAIVANSLFISRLPTELFLLILEHAILQCKPKDVALVSQAFRRGIDVILYRTVVIDSLKTLQLFHRTIQSKKPSFFADHVKNIVVIDHDIAPHSYFSDILAACSGTRSLVIPSSSTRPGNLWAKNYTKDHGSITRPPATMGLLDALTHVRFCEPADIWCSPTAMVEALGALPNLSHLNFARRINANQANDKMFVRSISDVLVSRPILKMLVVSIFPEAFATDNHASIRDSEIWGQMCELRCADQRLVVVQGRYDEWKEGWNDPQAIRSGWYPRDFWLRSIQNATYD
ncbi:hypothetical protein C0991_011315 [Blastosporella zonata]|nr:hypothetical protein C0991_011315 [Blastosporella zonata]